MDNQRVILGSGMVAGGVLILKSYVTGTQFGKPLVAIAIATILLAGLDAAGLGAIAAPMAMLLAGTLVVIYALPLLDKVQKVI